MTHLNPSRRRTARNVSRAGALLSAAMLAFGLAATPVGRATAAGVDSGSVQLSNTQTPSQPISSGGSGTVFKMLPPSGAACPGSGSGTPAYRWQTFMVAAAVDVSNLTYASGPNAVAGGAFVSPIYDSAGGTAVINQNPSASPLGLISGIPTISFSVFSPGNVAPGDYKIGFACTQAGATVSFWSTTITVVTDARDSPAQFAWSVAAASATTTTAAATTTTGAATTTTVRSATTTTVRAATTTTQAPTTTTSASSTSTTPSTSGSPTTTAAFASSATPTTSPSLASTGTSSSTLLIWAVLLLVFGRIAILLARPVRVPPHEER